MGQRGVARYYWWQGSAGLRRWNRGAYQLGSLSLSLRIRVRQTEGVRKREHGPAQPPDDGIGGLDALVRLVRFQRRQRGVGRRPRNQCVCGDEFGDRYGCSGLDGGGVGVSRETYSVGSGQRRRRWFGGDYAGVRVCRTALVNRDRSGGRNLLLHSSDCEVSLGIR